MLKSPRFWIGILISLVCLYFAFQGIDCTKLLEALVGINYFWLAVSSALFLVSYGVRVIRWQLLFSPMRLRLGNVFHALNVGYFLSNILPARLGDVARAYLIGELEGVSKARALSTVVVERLSDGLTVVLLISLTALFVPNIPVEAQQGAVVTAIAGIAGIAVLLVLSFNKERGLALLHRLVSPIKFLQHPKLWQILESLIDGFAVLRSPKAILGVGVCALLAWVIGGLTFWTASLATNSSLPLTAAFLVMTATSLMVVIPSSPGYVGVFHAGAVLILTTVFHADQTVALTFAIVIHALTYIWIIVLGVFSMWREGISMTSLQTMQASETKS